MPTPTLPIKTSVEFDVMRRKMQQHLPLRNFFNNIIASMSAKTYIIGGWCCVSIYQ